MSYSIVLEPKLAFAFGLVRADRVCRFQVVASVEQRFQNSHPRLVFAVVKGKSEDAAGFENAMCLAPALREQTLVETIRILWLARTVGNRFK